MKMRTLFLGALLAVGMASPAAHAGSLLDELLLPLTPLRAPASRAAVDAPVADVEPVAALSWLDNEHVLLRKKGQLLKVHALSGKEELYAGANFTALELDGHGPFAVPQKGKKLGGEGASPDGKWTISVRGGNLYLIDKATKAERKLTSDGSDVVLNGKSDWVYWEELFHRSDAPMVWWSPDSTHLAFLRLDDTDVPKFTIIDPTQRKQTPEVTRYPKVGAPNPTVKLGIAKVADGSIAWADFGDFPKDILISRVGWLPDSKAAYAYVQDRIQTWLDVCAVTPEGGKPTKLFRDQTEAWIEDIGPLKFLKDGSFLVFSERSGYKHLYHRAADGKLLEQITTGVWDVSKLDKIDEAEGWIYFTRTTDNWLGTQAYRAKIDGKGMEKLTKEPGTHEVLFSPDGRHFVDTFSTIETQPQIQLCRADGAWVRTIEKAPAQEQEKGTYQFVQIKTPDGFVMNGTVTLPPNVDKAKKYPVWLMTYAGPHMPQVRNASKAANPNDRALAAKGIIAFHVDPRSASGKGACSTWTAYRQLGVQELKDVETAIKWLSSHSYVDASRVGMTGTSYGGYITAYCLTHSKMFAAGIAGAPPTDWRNYDSIYTERYMGLPEDNPKGYEVSSVVKAAKNLHGKLLLVHGMKDDNVHVQNTFELMDEFQKANLKFEVMLYPHARHGGFGEHFKQLSNDFIKRTLQPGT